MKVGGRKSKVRKYLGSIPPTADQLARIRAEAAPEMEFRAAIKRAELTAGGLRREHLTSEVALAVEKVKSVYNSVLDLLTVNEVEAYERDFEISYVQGTTSIEGNTLTRGQAADLLLHGIMPRGKSLREINEVQNFKRVVTYRTAYKRRVSTEFVRNLHALVMDNIDLESAGQFRRRDDLRIAGCDLPVTPASVIPTALAGTINEYYGKVDGGWSPFESAVLFHYQFEMIHPFTDGNGRVGREVFNYMLTRAKYPRLLFLGKERNRYIEALKQGNEDDLAGLTSAFAQLIIDQRSRVLEQRLREIAPRTRKTGQMRLSDFVNS